MCVGCQYKSVGIFAHRDLVSSLRDPPMAGTGVKPRE